MKTTLKHTLSRAGIFPTLDTARRLPEVVGWLNNGCRRVFSIEIGVAGLAELATHRRPE